MYSHDPSGSDEMNRILLRIYRENLDEFLYVNDNLELYRPSFIVKGILSTRPSHESTFQQATFSQVPQAHLSTYGNFQ